MNHPRRLLSVFSGISAGHTFITFKHGGTDTHSEGEAEKVDGFQFSDISYLAMRRTLDPFLQ